MKNITSISHSLFFVVITLALLVSCKQHETGTKLYLRGSINDTFVKQLLTQNKPNTTIILSSSGGLPNQARVVVDNIIANKNDITIRGECFSACAEYLLPAAQSVTFHNGPMIGFHWNAMMIEYLMRQNARRDIEYCSFSDSKILNALQRNAGVNNEFWKEVLGRINSINFYVDYKTNACPWKEMEFENRIWLPTSEQLRAIYKLHFTGSVCADNFTLCTKKIDRRWKKGTRIMVGDTVYVSHSYNDANTRCKARRRALNHGLPFMRSKEKCEDNDYIPPRSP